MVRPYNNVSRLKHLFYCLKKIAIIGMTSSNLLELRYYPGMSLIMVTLDPADRKTFFERLDKDIDSAKTTSADTAALYTDVRTEHIEWCLAHEQSAHNPRKIDAGLLNHEVREQSYAEHVDTDSRLARHRRWLEAMVNWRHYLVELVGTLGTLRKIEFQIWDVVEAHKRAEQEEDDYLAQDALDMLRYDLLKIET